MLTQFLESLFLRLANSPRLRAFPPVRPLASGAVDGVPPASHIGIALGRTLPSGPDEPPEEVALDWERRRRHCYLLGGTGAGKTTLLLRLIAGDFLAGRTVVVFDLRGDLLDRVLPLLAHRLSPAEAADRLALMDFRDAAHVVGFNPLSASAGGGDFYARALGTLAVLRELSPSWGVTIDEIGRNSLLALAETGGSLVEVSPLLGSPSFRARVLEGVTDSVVRSYFAEYARLSPDRQAALAGPWLNKLSPLLALPQLRCCLGSSRSLSFPDLLDRRPGSVILIGLAADRLHGAAPLAGGLLLSALENAVMARASRPEGERRPVSVVVDEFQNFATSRFETLISESRKYQAALAVCHQTSSQLGPGLKAAVRGNAGSQFYFQTGAAEAQDLAHEIATGEAKDAVRDALIGMMVGECFLVRRGLPPRRMRVHGDPLPSAGPEAVAAQREAVLRACARPRAEVEAELAARASSTALMMSASVASATSAASTRASPSSSAISPPTTPPADQSSPPEARGLRHVHPPRLLGE